MKKTLKVPQTLYRQGEVEEKKDGALTLSISSDEPYLRYDWWEDQEYFEVLSHEPKDMDMSRLKEGAALLYNHDRNKHLGTINKPTTKGGRCYVEARLSEAPDCESFRIRIKEGILKDTSVGYSLTGDAEKIGEKDGKPIYKFKWQPFEASLVTVAADPSVGIGRERDHKPSGEPKEIMVEVAENNLDAEPKEANTQTKAMKLLPSVRQHFREEDNGGNATAGSAPKAVDEKKVRAEAIKAERERQKKIQEFVSGLKSMKGIDCSKIAEKYLTGDNADSSFDDFRQEVLETSFKASPVTQGNGRPSIEVIGERGEGLNQGGRIISVGRCLTDSEQYRSQGKGGSRRRNISVNIPELTSFRATATTGTITNFNGIVQIPNVIELGVQMATVADLLAQGTTNLAAIPFIQEDTNTNAATIVAEGAAKPEITWDWSQQSAPVKKIAVISKVSDELFADVPSIESYVNSRMRWMVEIAEDAALLTGADLPGILQTAGIQTQAKGADTTPDAVRKGMTKVQSVGFFPPDGFVVHPTDWEEISLLKDTNGQYLAGGPFYAPYGTGQYVQFYTFWGLKVVVTTSMTLGTGLVGSFKLGAMLWRRTGLTLDSTNSNEDDFEKNLITLRAEERLALSVWRPKAFCTVTGI